MVYSAASFLLLSLAGQASAKAVYVKRAGTTRTISTSYTDKSTGGDLGSTGDTTIITAGVQVWLSGRGYHSIRGNIQNAGSLIVSQTDSDTYSYRVPFAPSAQTVYWAGSTADNGNLINTGSIVLNDVAATSAPTYDWYLNSFQNAAGASIQWCGRGDTGGSTMQFYSKESSVNNGLIVFEQTQGNLGTALVWRNSVLTSSDAPSKTLTNNGGILMRNMRLDFVQNIQGNGCYIIAEKSNFYLQDGLGVYQNPNNGAALIGQSISFAGAGSALHMDTAVYAKNPDFGARVYGFGQGHSFEFYQIISAFSYSGSTLRVNFVGGKYVNINIGAGYNAGGFSKGSSVFYRAFNAINYSGTAPAASAPAQCLLTAPVCAPLTNGPGPNPLPTTTPVASPSVAPTSPVVTLDPATTSVGPAATTTPAATPSVNPTSTSTTSSETPAEPTEDPCVEYSDTL